MKKDNPRKTDQDMTFLTQRVYCLYRFLRDNNTSLLSLALEEYLLVQTFLDTVWQCPGVLFFEAEHKG
jgi:hypothetical protein